MCNWILSTRNLPHTPRKCWHGIWTQVADSVYMEVLFYQWKLNLSGAKVPCVLNIWDEWKLSVSRIQFAQIRHVMVTAVLTRPHMGHPKANISVVWSNQRRWPAWIYHHHCTCFPCVSFTAGSSIFSALLSEDSSSKNYIENRRKKDQTHSC